MIRFSVPLSIVLGFCLSSVAAYSQMLENNIERSGATYQQSPSGYAGANQCWSLCAADPKCKAWTWKRPGIAGSQGMCLLKSAVTPAISSPCCISGISAAIERQIEASQSNAPKPPQIFPVASALIPNRRTPTRLVNKISSYSVSDNYSRSSVNKITPTANNQSALDGK